jgi:hypothetical protein
MIEMIHMLSRGNVRIPYAKRHPLLLHYNRLSSLTSAPPPPRVSGAPRLSTSISTTFISFVQHPSSVRLCVCACVCVYTCVCANVRMRVCACVCVCHQSSTTCTTNNNARGSKNQITSRRARLLPARIHFKFIFIHSSSSPHLCTL